MDGGRARVPGAGRRGDLPAALPPAGADDRARPDASTTSTLGSETMPDHRPRSQSAVLRVAVPNKGSLAEPAADMLRESGYRQRVRPARARAARPRRTTSSSSSCARATSRCTSGRASSTSASPAATCCSTAVRRPRRSCSWASRESTFRFAARPGAADDGERLRGHAGRHVVRRPAREVLRRPRHRRRGRAAGRCRRDRRAARRRRRDRRRGLDRDDAAPGRAGGRRGADPRVGGRAGPPGTGAAERRRSTSWCAGCRASSSPGGTS